MRTIPATVITAALLLALAACGSDDDSKTQPSSTTSAPTTAPALSHAEIVERCTAAVAALPPGPNGEVPSTPTPPPCTSLSDHDYLDAYMDGVAQSNQQGRDALEDAITAGADGGQ